MKTCPNCGAVCGDDHTFCSKCGYRFEAYGAYQNAKDTNQTYDYRSPNEATPRNNPKPPVTNPLSIASLVLGIVGVVFLCCRFIGIILSVLAIIMGIVSQNDINNSQGSQTGMGFSTAGLTLGIIGVSLAVLEIILASVFGLSLLNMLRGFSN